MTVLLYSVCFCSSHVCISVSVCPSLGVIVRGPSTAAFSVLFKKVMYIFFKKPLWFHHSDLTFHLLSRCLRTRTQPVCSKLHNYLLNFISFTSLREVFASSAFLKIAKRVRLWFYHCFCNVVVLHCKLIFQNKSSSLQERVCTSNTFSLSINPTYRY